MEKGVERRVVDVSEWNPTSHQFSFALSLLPQHHHSSVTRFVKMEDRKRALVSRLLQYALVHQLLGIPFHQIIIKRTVEGKPYLEHNEDHPDFPNFNFNTSHHGDYVAIASEPLCLVGLDIVSPVIIGKETVVEFIGHFSQYFSAREWDCIVNAGASDQILIEFYRYWSLKEAFVKAMGTGLAYRLDKIEFRHTNWTDIHVNTNEKDNNEWRFWISELGKRHLVSIARGHPTSAAESYKRTLKRVDFGEEEYRLALHIPNASFKLQTVEQLISVQSRAVYGNPAADIAHWFEDDEQQTNSKRTRVTKKQSPSIVHTLSPYVHHISGLEPAIPSTQITQKAFCFPRKKRAITITSQRPTSSIRIFRQRRTGCLQDVLSYVSSRPGFGHGKFARTILNTIKLKESSISTT